MSGLRDRVVGGVLGLALGDALGAPFEFRRAHDVPRPVPALELPWTGFPPGSTTDDTAMARNLLRSLVERGGFDPDDVAARHLEWFRTNPPDVGTVTRRVLRRVERGERAEEAARAVWQERGPEVSAGNGSVMYCAPLGLAFALSPQGLADAAPRLSAITHFDQRCRTAVLSVTLCAASLARGEPGREAVTHALEAVIEREGGEELEFLVEAAGTRRPVDGPDQGFCLYTAALGLQAAAADGSFEERVLHVVSLGGDTDTNAAVAGALVGARVGVGGLPASWLQRLVEREEIEREALALADVAGRG